MSKRVSLIGIIVCTIIIVAIFSFFYKIYKKFSFNDFLKVQSIENVTSFFRDEDNKYGEKSSYKIESTDYNDAMFYKNIKVIPNTAYKLSCMIKTENVQTKKQDSMGGAQISIMGSLEQSNSIIGTNDWQKMELLFNSKSKSNIEIGFRLGGNNEMCKGSAWFSDFKLEIGTIDSNTEWNMACFIIKNVDVKLERENTNIKLSMKSSDVSKMKSNMQRFAITCDELSNHKMTVKYDVFEIEQPLTSVSYSEEFKYFVGPDNVKKLINEYLEKKEYDHIFVCVRLGDMDKKIAVPVTDWIGLGGMNYSTIGYSNIRLPNERDDYNYTYDPSINLFPEEVFLHEFLHTLEANLIKYGYSIPALHDYEKYGYNSKELFGLKEWYQDYMLDKIKASEGSFVGLNSIVYSLKPVKKSDFNYSVEIEFNKEPKNIIEEIIVVFQTIKESFARRDIEYET